MSWNMPTLRFELEGMRHTLLTYLADYNEQLERHVADELEHFIKDYDFAAMVRREMGPILEEAISGALKNHFRYGKGRDALEAAIEAAIAPEPPK